MDQKVVVCQASTNRKIVLVFIFSEGLHFAMKPKYNQSMFCFCSGKWTVHILWWKLIQHLLWLALELRGNWSLLVSFVSDSQHFVMSLGMNQLVRSSSKAVSSGKSSTSLYGSARSFGFFTTSWLVDLTHGIKKMFDSTALLYIILQAPKKIKATVK